MDTLSLVHLKVELGWLPLIGFARGILIELLVLTDALILTLALLSRVEFDWLLLVGLAHGILIDLLVLTGALVLTLALLSRASEVENLAAGWIVVISRVGSRQLQPAVSIAYF